MRIMKSHLVIPAVLLLGIPASAHHSIDATYDLGQEVQIEGRVLAVLIRNPHSFLYIEVPENQGVRQRWVLEWQHGAGKLAQQGIHLDTLKAGDELAVTMNPGRRQDDHRGALLSLSRKADGFEWAEPRKKGRARRDKQI